MQHSTSQYDDLARVPRAQTREGCRRRTIASRHRRHSSARCSCRVAPPIRNARFVDLIRRSSSSTQAGARNGFGEPRDWGPKSTLSRPRPAAETTRPAFEPAKVPANCGLFVRDQKTPVRIGLHGGPGRCSTSQHRQWLACQTVPKGPFERKRVSQQVSKLERYVCQGIDHCRRSCLSGEGDAPMTEAPAKKRIFKYAATDQDSLEASTR